MEVYVHNAPVESSSEVLKQCYNTMLLHGGLEQIPIVMTVNFGAASLCTREKWTNSTEDTSERGLGLDMDTRIWARTVMFR